MNKIDFIKEKFVENFNVNRISLELMDLIEENKLKEYIYNQFKDNFMYGELYYIFKNSNLLNNTELKNIMEEIGHEFVDIDKLPKEEKEKYF